MKAIPPQRALLERPLPSRRYNRPLQVEAHCAASTNRKRSRLCGCRGKKKEKKEKEKKERKKEGREENRKNELSIFRNCDLQFILTVLLLNNKNKM
jgi:hypothetical protein